MPSDSSSAVSSPWFDDFGSERRHDSKVLLSLSCPVILPLTGGLFSPALSHVALLLYGWAEFSTFVCAPVHHEGKERGCGFSELSRPVHRLWVDLRSGVSREFGRRWPILVDLFPTSQLSSPLVALPLVWFHGRGDSCLSPILGQALRLCIPSLRSVSLRAQQVQFQQGYSPHFVGSASSTEVWFLEFWGFAMALLIALPLGTGLLSRHQFHRLCQNLLVLQLHAWSLCSVLRVSRSLSGRGSWVVIVSSQLLSQALPASVGGLSPQVLCSRPFILESFRHWGRGLSLCFVLLERSVCGYYPWIQLDPFPGFHSVCLAFRTTSSLGFLFPPSCWSALFARFLSCVSTMSYRWVFIVSTSAGCHWRCRFSCLWLLPNEWGSS